MSVSVLVTYCVNTVHVHVLCGWLLIPSVWPSFYGICLSIVVLILVSSLTFYVHMYVCLCVCVCVHALELLVLN